MASAGKAQDETVSAQKSDAAPSISLVVPNFKGASDSEIARLSDAVEEQQEFIYRTLLSQLHDEHLSPLARTEMIALLGSFPPMYETITALIENIDVISVGRPDDSFSGPRYPGFIARHMLFVIGMPAESRILDIIGSARPTDEELKANPGLSSEKFDSSKIEGFADVLTRIEGKQRALSKLQNAQTKAETPATKAQFQAVIEVVKKGAAPAYKY